MKHVCHCPQCSCPTCSWLLQLMTRAHSMSFLPLRVSGQFYGPSWQMCFLTTSFLNLSQPPVKTLIGFSSIDAVLVTHFPVVVEKKSRIRQSPQGHKTPWGITSCASYRVRSLHYFEWSSAIHKHMRKSNSSQNWLFSWKIVAKLPTS